MSSITMKSSPKLPPVIFLLLMFIALNAGTALAAEKITAGSACNTGTDTNVLDWDTVWQCIGNVWVRGSVILGGISACGATNVGAIGYTAGSFQGCTGTGPYVIASLSVTTPSIGTSASMTSPLIAGDPTSGFFTPAANTIAVATAGVERLRIDSSGNVGIGTTAPLSKLDVNGGVSMGTYGNVNTGPSGSIIASTGMVIGSSAITTGTSIDMGSNTSSMILPYGSTPGQFTYSAGQDGGLRFDTDINNLRGTVGNWVSLIEMQPATLTAPAAGNGYLVLTATTYNGNLGGLSGANAKCLTELGTTHTDWFGYTTANANGQVVAGKVFAYLCDGSSCNSLQASTRYYFGAAGDSTVGGSWITSDVSGQGPNNNLMWSAINVFGRATRYWGSRGNSGGTVGTNTSAGVQCATWASASSLATGSRSYTGSIGAARYNDASANGLACNNTLPLICFVNP